MTPRHPAGFTLLEILVALVVLGFLMVGLSQGTQFGLRAWGMQSAMINERGDLDAIDRTIRRLVARMDPGSPTRDSMLRGTPSRVAFRSDLPIAAERAASRRADMLLMVDGAHRLVLRWTPYWHASRFGSPPVPQDTELLRGVDRVEISYWPSAGSVWQPTWTGRELPALIRFRTIFPGGDPRRWPDIVAAPMLDRQER